MSVCVYALLHVGHFVNEWLSVSCCLQAVAELRKTGLEMNFSFLNYAQSSECRNWQDSSVSYAAGALIVHWGRLSQGPLQHRPAPLLLSLAITWPRHPPSPSLNYTHYLQEGPRHSKPIQSPFSLSLSLGSPATLHPPFSLKCVSELLVETFCLKCSFEIL